MQKETLKRRQNKGKQRLFGLSKMLTTGGGGGGGSRGKKNLQTAGQKQMIEPPPPNPENLPKPMHMLCFYPFTS